LLDTLKDIKVEKDVVELLPLDKWTNMIVDLRVLWVPQLISLGFTCIMHYAGQEYEVTIEKIKGHTFLKAGEKAECVIKSSTPIYKTKETRKFLLRFGNNTVGFGKILKIR
jgi:GTPase